MNLQQATQLAEEIEADPRYLVVAIGRFQILADLVVAPDSYPWCITVIPSVGGESPAKICSHADWRAYRTATAPVPQSPPPPKSKRRDDEHMKQPTLF